jgi:hypothetical protein
MVQLPAGHYKILGHIFSHSRKKTMNALVRPFAASIALLAVLPALAATGGGRVHHLRRRVYRGWAADVVDIFASRLGPAHGLPGVR